MGREIKLWIEGGYVYSRPDYGAFYVEGTNERVYITDYGVSLKENAKRMIEHHNSDERVKKWKFKRMFHDKKHRCMIIVVEEEE